jgi:predicted AlkP superfamily pyrophosphatase or phosphodiesterase
MAGWRQLFRSASPPSLLQVARELPWDGARQPTIVLLIDGLGAGILETFSGAMPALWSSWQDAGAPLARSCFPSTTVACLPTLGRATAPAEHGFVGYSFRAGVNGEARVVHPTKLDADFPPLARDGAPAASAPRGAFVAAARLGGSYLSREAFPRAVTARPGRWRTGRRLARLAATRGLAFFYFDAVDAAAHRHGLGSGPHLAAMRRADSIYRELAAGAGFRLLVIADHGMVPVDRWLTLEDHLAAEDLAAVAGEARAAHLYARAGRAERLAESCRAIPGATVMTREEAEASGLFDGALTAPVRERVGDVVVSFERAGMGLTWAGGPGERRALAQHGGLSEAELLVPLLDQAVG